MSLDSVLRDEAEQAEYVRVVSKRIGELMAERISAEGFVNASDEDLQNLAITLLLLVMNELGDEALASASETAQSLGFDKPSPAALDQARQAALESNANRLYTALEEERAKAQKAAAKNNGNVPESLALGILAALTIAFADAAQGLATDIPVEMNGAMAEAAASGAGAEAAGAADAAASDASAVNAAVTDAAAATAAADAATAAEDDSAAGDLVGGVLVGGVLGILFGGARDTSTLTWITRRDSSVCHEDGPAVKTPSGEVMPAGAGTSCEARHGVTLPASDWVSEGFPRDSRLLCSRFKRPRCRCILSALADVPDGPMDIGPEVKRGRKRGEDEPLDLTDQHLQGLSVEATGHKLDANLFELKIRVTRRGAPAGAKP